MRGDHEIVSVNDKVAHRSRRQIELEGLPGIAVVKRKVDTAFRASVKQGFANGIFADAIQKAAVGDSGGNALPALAEIPRSIQIRLQVFQAVTVHSSVSRGRIRVRRLDMRYFAPGRELGRRDVGPRFAFVLRELNKSVIRTDPYFSRSEIRRCDGVNHTTAFAFGRIRGRCGVEIRGHAGIFARQVRANGLPGTAAVSGAEQ